MSNGRQYDLRPVSEYEAGLWYEHGETLVEFIDRTICLKPAWRLRAVWGWPRMENQHFEASWVSSPYVPHTGVNLFIQGSGSG